MVAVLAPRDRAKSEENEGKSMAMMSPDRNAEQSTGLHHRDPKKATMPSVVILDPVPALLGAA